MSGQNIDYLLGSERRNAIAAWLVVGVIGLVVAGSAFTGDPLWAGFAAAVAALAVLPPIVARSWRRMLPWEILALGGLPIIGRLVTSVQLNSQVATYLSVAALALVVAVELHAFTTVRMTPTFAVLFVVVATMATVGIWAVVRFALDTALGTTFLLDPARTDEAIERAVMIEFVASTVAGILAGVVFELYVRRRAVVGTVAPGDSTDRGSS